MNTSNIRILQIMVYARKFFRTLIKESLISIIIGIVITLLVMMVTAENMFKYYEGTKSGFFSLVCVCIWIGLFNSIQLVCREKNDIVKDELDKSLHASSYIAAHYIYQTILSAIQSIIIFVIFFIAVTPEGNPIAYLITIFLLILSSDALALVLSCAMPTPVLAMTVMPLVLLIQLVMAGVLFELEEGSIAYFISFFTMSKWGMSAFGMIGNITHGIESKVGNSVNEILTEKGLPEDMLIESDDMISSTDKNAFSGEAFDIFLCWAALIAFVVVCFGLGVIFLKATTRKLKK